MDNQKLPGGPDDSATMHLSVSTPISEPSICSIDSDDDLSFLTASDNKTNKVLMLLTTMTLH